MSQIGNSNKQTDRTQLTPREAEIWELRQQGLTVAQIAEQLGSTSGTIGVQLKSINIRLRQQKEQENG